MVTRLDDAREVLEKFSTEYPDNSNVDKFYDQMSGDGYDNFVKLINYDVPENIVTVIGPDQVVDINPQTSEILDIGAGTGRVGLNLKEKGFRNITGVDASESMLEKLDACGAYKASRIQWLGLGVDKYPDDLKGKFDLVTASGVLLKGHIPALGLEDMHASLKEGGYLVASTRSIYWANGQIDGYKDKADEMIAQGKFEMVHTHQWDG